MNNEPLITITYLPTEEDYYHIEKAKKNNLKRPGIFENPKHRTRAQTLILFGVPLSILLLMVIPDIALLLLCFFLFMLVTEELSIFPPGRGRLRTEFTETKNKTASQNIFIREDGIEIKSVFEEVRYPWSLLTGWTAGKVILFEFGDRNVRCIPERVLTQAQRENLEKLLKSLEK